MSFLLSVITTTLCTFILSNTQQWHHHGTVTCLREHLCCVGTTSDANVSVSRITRVPPDEELNAWAFSICATVPAGWVLSLPSIIPSQGNENHVPIDSLRHRRAGMGKSTKFVEGMRKEFVS